MPIPQNVLAIGKSYNWTMINLLRGNTEIAIFKEFT